MSVQEERSEIVRENVVQLIKQLTGFEDDDENMGRCEQFAWSIIRNHRNLSTNSHEVRRKIVAIEERFRVENYSEYAEYFEQLCEEIACHPLCLNHYETDVHWSLLDFLLTLAYNPIGALKRNKHGIPPSSRPIRKETQEEEDEANNWKEILREDFIELGKLNDYDSDLSDWSVEDGDVTNEVHAGTSCNESQALFHEPVDTECGDIQPPTKPKCFVLFDGKDAEEKLRERVQHSWWSRKEQCRAQVESDRLEANFSILSTHLLRETSNNLVHCEEPATITEHNIMREILWMFHKPEKCGIFTIDDTGIKIRPNVSIPSLTVSSLANFLEDYFLPYINMMDVLRRFHNSVYSCDDCGPPPPRTIECYAANLQMHLAPIWQKLLEYEKRLIEQRDFEINTLINMRTFFCEVFHQLKCLYELHQQVVLDWRQYPAHISSAFLLSSLMRCHQIEGSVTKANLAMSLLLSSIKVFCEIMDTWWLEGRLEDWQQEYIVERISSADQSVCMREYRKNKQKSFFVPTYVTNIILENSLFQLLCEHSLEAGSTLNLLYEIDRMGDLCNACDVIEDKLYNVFLDDVLKTVETLQSEVLKTNKTEGNSPASGSNDSSNEHTKRQTLHPSTDNLGIKNLTTTDKFLLMAFTVNNSSSESGQENDTNPRSVKLNARGIFDRFQRTKSFLPLEEVLIGSLKRILNLRTAFANSFVMHLYRDEFFILKHLQNIRKILLLEASDLMYQFYDKLFGQIESGESWANSSLLTMQLDDIISVKYPDMSSMFRIEIISMFRCQTSKVYEAVDELFVTYNFNRELRLIIGEEDIRAYNKVFRFLLKIKWGITTLEKLYFPHAHKNRIPYAPFEMVDLIMRRLEQLRFWMIYALQSVHFHLMTHVLQSMGEQLDMKINNCSDLKEIEMVHKSYLSTVCEHCFLVDSLNAIKLGIEQLLSLICILRLEWVSCVKCIESNNPLALDLSDSSSDCADMDYVANSQIDAIELTYIRCHQYLANKLNNEVYVEQKSFLSGLSAAFNTSLPY